VRKVENIGPAVAESAGPVSLALLKGISLAKSNASPPYQGLGGLCQHNFEFNGSQMNVSSIEHNSFV